MLTSIFDLLEVALFEIILGLITTWFGGAYLRILRTEKAQETFDSAIRSGIAFALDELEDVIADQLARFGRVDFESEAIEHVVGRVRDYVDTSSPDAVKALNASAEAVTNKIRAVLNSEVPFLTKQGQIATGIAG